MYVHVIKKYKGNIRLIFFSLFFVLWKRMQEREEQEEQKKPKKTK